MLGFESSFLYFQFTTIINLIKQIAIDFLYSNQKNVLKISFKLFMGKFLQLYKKSTPKNCKLANIYQNICFYNCIMKNHVI